MLVTSNSITAACIRAARDQIGISHYNWEHDESNPPDVVNCYTFVAWVFTLQGIHLPYDLSEQRAFGQPVDLHNAIEADVIFTPGSWNGFGHNGILTAEGTIIHASQKAKTVIEEDLDVFRQNKGFKCVVRIIDSS